MGLHEKTPVFLQLSPFHHFTISPFNTANKRAKPGRGSKEVTAISAVTKIENGRLKIKRTNMEDCKNKANCLAVRPVFCNFAGNYDKRAYTSLISEK